MAKERVISVILEDGSLNGVVQVNYRNQGDVLIISSPRSSTDKMFEYEESGFFGVYLLLSDSKVYIGQASDLQNRIKTHKSKMDWWTQVILITKKLNDFNHSDIDYIENVLIEKAKSNNIIDVKNKKSGNKFNIQREDKIVLDEYIENALFLLEFIGVNVFVLGDAISKTKIQLVSNQVLQLVQRGPALKFLSENNYIAGPCSYSKRDDNYNRYAIDSQISLTEDDWTIVLNNQIDWCFYIFFIPKNTITPDMIKKFKTRKDDANRLALRIKGDSFIETSSGFEFSKFLVRKIPYGDK